MDVFPFDNAKSGWVPYLRRWVVKKFHAWIFRKMGLVKENSVRSKVMNALLFFVNTKFLKKCRDNLCRTEMNNDNCTHFISMGSHYKTEKVLFLKEKLLPVSQVEFEGKIYCAPRDPDYFLKVKIGSDYMQLPPIEKRITHNPAMISFNTEEGYEEI